MDEGGRSSENAGLAVVLAGCFSDREVDPDAFLARHYSMVGWAKAVLEAGARSVALVQRFRRDAIVRRDGVDYHFVSDDDASLASSRFWGSNVTTAIRRLKPTAVHVDGLVFPLVVRHLRVTLPRRTSILVQDHGGVPSVLDSFRGWPKRAFYRFGLGGADAFLFTAREQAAPWVRAGIIGGGHAVHEIPESSTNMGSWPVLAQGQSSLPGRPALLWVGRLESNKDPLTVLEGFRQTTNALPDAALTLAYDGEDLLSEVQSRIAKSSELRDRVHLRGFVDQRAMPTLYAGADLFILGSHREVACFALIEALSFGVTPIVTDIAAFRAITGRGRVGTLFTPGNAGMLARAIERASHGDLATRRESVRAYFESELSWAVVGRRALDIYRAAVASRSRKLSA